ncbi:MAG: isoprenylcysteine carboxylmethyltransferase family protein [Myxococcota bacterium]|jgi:protein-S-isoprenylcysteine O-methyltransferase Ste14|nr:isoprenylcysteine carboxylmethyltransferase family protein [Myxococcota bacterium]
MSEAESERGAAVRFPPPFVPVIALVVGAVIQAFVGALPNPLTGSSRYFIGGALLVTGVAILISANGHFRRTGQDPKPWKVSPELLGSGVYAWTRNPMYLSMGVLQAALGILFDNMWVVLLVPVTWFTIYHIAIRHEETYLEDKFGGPYSEYKDKVRRWL